MTGTPLRIDGLALETTNGIVSYTFRGSLTVLSGPVGTGKSTLLELIKHCLGGRATISPVAEDHITLVRLFIRIGRGAYQLSRSIGETMDSVEVRELPNREFVGSFSADPSREPALSKFLLTELDLPTDARAASLSKGSTKTPGKITFNDIYAYLYADQPEIDRSINHHSENYREPKRRTTFDILFGLTDQELLRLRAGIQEIDKSISEAAAAENSAKQFLSEVGASDREQLILEQDKVQTDLDRELGRIERLRNDSDPDDPDTDVVRDLLNATKDRLDRIEDELRALDSSIAERERLAAGLRQDEARLGRVRDAASRLASIEFVVCPRCSQSIRDRSVEPETCSLCLQPDPSTLSAPAADSYELRQLQGQQEEVSLLLETARRNRQILTERAVEVRDHLARLAGRLDERTRDYVSPRLQSFSDASASVARSRERLVALEDSLRYWDRVADLEQITLNAQARRAEVDAEVAERTARLAARREILDELSTTYLNTLQSLGVPGVRTAYIDPLKYLPIVDGKLFSGISTGGIRTALIVAYWVTLLATAVREGQCEHPTLLILDSPRKSIGQGEALAENLYRQLDSLAEISGAQVQIIVADNSFLLKDRARWQEYSFDYENPAVPTIPHPGPARVRTIDQILADRSE